MTGFAPTRPVEIVEAPSRLGLRASGVERLGEALLAAGLSERLEASAGERVAPRAFDPERDPETGILNPAAIRDYAYRLADSVAAILDRGSFPVILGGDCTILLGTMLALRRRGRFGLWFIDGHADFYQPEAEPTGEAASMELAFATGRGPDVVADFAGYRPLVRDDDVVVFGHRDAKIAAQEGSRPLPRAITGVDLDAIRERGVASCAREALERLERRDGPPAFWLHLDVDVLDDAVMPAVDYRLPGGLSWEELVAVLRIAADSPRLIGIQVTIFNPTLDSEGRLASALVDALVAGLRSTAVCRR